MASWIGSMIPTRRSAVTGSGRRWRAAAAAATKQAVTSSEGPGCSSTSAALRVGSGLRGGAIFRVDRP